MKYCDFSKCDFEGTIFYDTIFYEVQLSACDIKSSYFNKCEFINCSFDLSAITDTDFIECKFINCSYRDALMRNITYNYCVISSGDFEMSTITVSKFNDCVFDNVLLGDCSFYDHIISNCRFSNVTINIDAVGRIFGLTIENLKQFKYIFLGKIYGFAPDEFFIRLDKIFENKEWRLQNALYKYNIGSYAPYEYVIKVFETLTYFISNNIIVKHDDLIFLANIIDTMKKKNNLSIFALYQGLENLGTYMDCLIQKKYINKEEIFREFMNKMFFVFNELLVDFSKIFPEKLETMLLQEKVLVKIHYEADKEIDFSKYINNFLKCMGYNNSYYCHLLEIKSGSIIEIIAGTIVSVYALQILLYGLNGVLIQLTDMLSKVNVIRNVNYQKDFLSNSIKGRQRQPELLQNSFELLKNKEFKDNLASLASILSKSKVMDIVTSEEQKKS